MVFKLLTLEQHKHYEHRSGLHVTAVSDINYCELADAIDAGSLKNHAICYVVYRNMSQLKQYVNYLSHTHTIEII